MHLNDNCCRCSKLLADKLSVFGISELNTRFEQRHESAMKLELFLSNYYFEVKCIYSIAASWKKKDNVFDAWMVESKSKSR